MRWPFGDLVPGIHDFGMFDPPWNFDLWSTGGQKKSPQEQYETMTLDEVCRLPVRDLLKPRGGVVWLWSTWPMVARGDHATVLKAWGLFGRTGGSWAKRTRFGKLRMGTGFIFRTVSEPYFIATTEPRQGSGLNGRRIRGMIEALDGEQFDGLAREHSRKPDRAYEICEELMPGAVRADVYARERRKGWHGFGRELDKFEAASA